MKDQTELFPPPADCQSWRTWQLLSKMATVGHVTDGQADRHSQPWRGQEETMMASWDFLHSPPPAPARPLGNKSLTLTFTSCLTWLAM